MGIHVYAEDVKSKSRLEEIRVMESEDIELLLIRPAERRLEEEFCMDLDTDGEPRAWVNRFASDPRLLAEFLLDWKASVILLCDRMETNPHGFASSSVSGATASFGKRMPEEVRTLMRRWSRPRGVRRA